MLRHISYHRNWAEIVLHEILTDSLNSWYHPKGPVGGGDGVGDFDYGRMKFVNRNLNYYFPENMISMALKNQYEYNFKYEKTLEFCNFLRPFLHEQGPFGRMCIWKLPPKGYLLPHVDNWPYHRQIRRYIFCVSAHDNTQATIKIDDVAIPVTQGLLFQFNPAYEKHEFVNHIDSEWYFLGFDYWDESKLQSFAQEKNIDINTNIQYQQGYGGFGSKCKFMSKE